jgi:hypothetical protein
MKMPSNISLAKLDANRANAALSTGPRTAEGKQASKFNRLSHGLASPLAVLPFEDQSEYDKVLAAFHDDYNPVGATEEALVKQIADANWKLRRLEKLEAAAFDAILAGQQNEPTDPYQAIAASLLGAGQAKSALALLARYQGTLNRQFLSCVKELRTIQKQRKTEHRSRTKKDLLRAYLGHAEKSDTPRPAHRTAIPLSVPGTDFS